ERVSITVSDNGPGIPPATLPKIFDPFFSTKQVGEGMGLGLSVSYGIAREMGGDLSASNLPDGGAQFKLTLNAAEPDQTGAS
ncbi:MAG: sensor histidine kinase, partial [Gammaproteobacteria bacterium]